MKASAGRWSKTKERAFLTELAAGATVRRACAAVGLSDTALYNRRASDPHFAKAWAAVAEVRRVRLGEYLVEAVNRALDPDSLPIDEDEAQLPKPTIAEAIQIAKMKGPAPAADAPPGCEEIRRGVWRPVPPTLDEVKDSILTKLDALIRADRKKLEPLGWSWDEEHRMLIPPGWVRDPEWKPVEAGS